MSLYGCRCNLCQRTDIISLCETEDDYVKGPFVVDPQDSTKTLCLECDGAIKEAVEEFGWDDEEDEEEDEEEE